MKSDAIMNFPLRGAFDDQLATALALCHRDFLFWYGHAVTVARFPIDAQAAGVESVFISRTREALDLSETSGIINFDPSRKTLSNSEIASEMASKQLEMVTQSALVAAVVMLHSACERELWRFIRFGLISNRNKAIEHLRDRKISVVELSHTPVDDLIDHQLEKWSTGLERASLKEKWKTLVELVGYPQLHADEWHFDQKMLEDFDKVRHDCVHHYGQRLRTFDFPEFAKQLWRAQWVWLAAVTRPLQIQISGEVMYGLSAEQPQI